MGRTDRALTALWASPPRPVLSWVFLAMCAGVTIASLVEPRLYGVFGGLEPRTHAWQPLTAPLEHGWPGFSGAIHLGLNAFLILECGPPCERLLGHGRFALLAGASWLVNAAVVSLTDGVNGASLVIWSFGPPLLVALRAARARDRSASGTDAYARVRTILILMYGVITVGMAVLPYAFGWRGNPLVSLLRANLYHGVATGVGIALAVAWRGRIARRLDALAGVPRGS